jgi:hypothetical protein
MAAMEEVTTTLFTEPAALAAFSALKVPSFAGIIKSFSCFGALAGNGLATCNT